MEHQSEWWLILFGKYRYGLVNSLPVEESETVHSFVLGLGKTTIIVNAFSAQGVKAEKTMSGFIFGSSSSDLTHETNSPIPDMVEFFRIEIK